MDSLVGPVDEDACVSESIDDSRRVNATSDVVKVQSSNTECLHQATSPDRIVQSVDDVLVENAWRYRVVHSPLVYVREDHDADAALLGYKPYGDLVFASYEFDDWIKLANEDGWMLRDGRSIGLGLLLEAERDGANNVRMDEDLMRAEGEEEEFITTLKRRTSSSSCPEFYMMATPREVGHRAGNSPSSARLKQLSSIASTLATCEKQLEDFEAEVDHLDPKTKDERLPLYRDLARQLEALSARSLEIGCERVGGGAMDLFEQSTLAIERIANLISVSDLLSGAPPVGGQNVVRVDESGCKQAAKDVQITTNDFQANEVAVRSPNHEKVKMDTKPAVSCQVKDDKASAKSVSQRAELMNSVVGACCSCCFHVSTQLHTMPGAEKAWIKANAADNCTVLEVAASVPNYSYLDGVYAWQRARSQAEAPIYRRGSGTLELDWWIYYASDGRWHIGRSHQLSRLKPTRRIRSAECKPGVLPHLVGGWERFTAIGWISTSMRMDGSKKKDMRKKWKECDAVTLCWTVNLSRDDGQLCYLNGAYDIEPALLIDDVPVFKKRRESMLERQKWIYLGRDSRWYVGTTRDKDERNAGRCLRSAICKPGTLPTVASGWEELHSGGRCVAWIVWNLCDCTRMPDINMRTVCECPGGLALVCSIPSCIGWTPSNIKVTAANRGAEEGAWKKSHSAKIPFEIKLTSRWCCAPWAGTFDVQEKNSLDYEIAFRRKSRICGLGLWLYFARDNRWYVGSRRAKNQHRRSFLLRSCECKPGMYPGDVDGWESFKACVWCPADVSVGSKTYDQVVAEKQQNRNCIYQAFSGFKLLFNRQADCCLRSFLSSSRLASCIRASSEQVV